jgi:hypothetical protein
MGVKRALWLATALWAWDSAYGAQSSCKIAQIAEWHVDRVQNRPIVEGQINGQSIHILIDTGTGHSYIAEAAAWKLGLPVRQSNDRRAFTVGGIVQVKTTVIDHLKVGTFDGDNLRFDVINTTPLPGVDFMLGADFFWHFATEFDLANGKVRILQPTDCKPEQLVYWGQSYFVANLERMTSDDAEIDVYTDLNGSHAKATLDTGSPISFASTLSARAAGVKSDDAGLAAAPSVKGVGGSTIPTWIGRFDTFAIGDETIRNAKLRIGDLYILGGQWNRVMAKRELILGCDFLMAHRVIVQPREHVMVFSYNGGPVFQLIHPDDATQGDPADGLLPAPPQPTAEGG